MPRKQRFKPSRKPKPIPQSEAATIGHDARNTTSQKPAAHDSDADAMGGSSRMSDEDSSQKPETDQASR